MRVNVSLIGFGNVGRTLASLLAVKGKLLRKKFGIDLRVIAVADSRGAAIKEQGFTPYELLKLTELPRSSVSSYKPYGAEKAGVEEIYSQLIPDIHVEATPTDYVSGEPSTSNVLYALRKGANVVSCSKSPFALKYQEIMKLASRRGLKVRFKATVMAGTPLVDLLMSLKGYEVSIVRGILNGTTNYILTEMHENLSTYEDALIKAQAMGIAEPDPELDVKGWDPAAKITIISNVLGRPIRLDRVERDDLSQISVKEVYAAIRKGFTIKFLAELDLYLFKATVKLVKVPSNSIFASVNGTLNAVEIKTEVNDITLIGKGAGASETAHAMLDDIVTIAQEVQHAGHNNS